MGMASVLSNCFTEIESTVTAMVYSRSVVDGGRDSSRDGEPRNSISSKGKFSLMGNLVRIGRALESKYSFLYETVMVPFNLKSLLEAPTLMPKLPVGTIQFWLATSQ